MHIFLNLPLKLKYAKPRSCYIFSSEKSLATLRVAGAIEKPQFRGRNPSNFLLNPPKRSLSSPKNSYFN